MPPEPRLRRHRPETRQGYFRHCPYCGRRVVRDGRHVGKTGTRRKFFPLTFQDVSRIHVRLAARLATRVGNTASPARSRRESAQREFLKGLRARRLIQEEPMTYKIKGDRRAEAHPAAEAFPLPEDSGIQTLAENIQRNGLLTTVLLQRIGGRDLVVDGRCRLLACERVDCTPSVRYINPEEDPIEVIVSTNLCRRHQSPSQRALAAARLTTILGPGRPQKIDSLEAISAPRAGEMFGISRSSVGRAKAILKHALLVAAVESGAVTVGGAWEIRETDAEAQRKALEAVATGTATSLLAALEQNAPKDPDGVASDHAAARRSGRSASGPPGAEPNGALQEESAPSDPPSAASGPSAEESEETSRFATTSVRRVSAHRTEPRLQHAVRTPAVSGHRCPTRLPGRRPTH